MRWVDISCLFAFFLVSHQTCLTLEERQWMMAGYQSVFLVPLTRFVETEGTGKSLIWMDDYFSVCLSVHQSGISHQTLLTLANGAVVLVPLCLFK